MNWKSVYKIRMDRLGFTKPAEDEKSYDEIFKNLQPIPTDYFSEPGRPPSLRDRVTFDDIEYNRHLRQNQDIIKARFQGNTISYVRRDELELYAAAFAKPISKIDETAFELYTVLNQVGPMDKQQLTEELDLKGPVVTKILQKYQKAFMVFELQPDRFGEQVWQTFEGEWPEFNINSITQEQARCTVIKRFIKNMAAVDFDMVKDWSRFSKKDTLRILEVLVEKGELMSFEEDEKVYFLPEDKGIVLNRMMVSIQPSVYVIHKADYIYRAYESRLKAKYKGREILQYLLIDGEFNGVVEGHWRIGPHNVENVIVDLPDDQAKIRKNEILAAVAEYYHPPYSNILKYNGESAENK